MANTLHSTLRPSSRSGARSFRPHGLDLLTPPRVYPDLELPFVAFGQ
ncbi:MAG: hypothetical protein AVDCRST_MAG55-2483 [uncultured Rubrobacteraceae bacterium]|uniref:Uncharacterized protein n=1 Tax=uncultured Rubrobacteraceae bacterium TaxID=349277 RepID=A0A6J4PYS7_9ACTN|nr:MAG: hypothetical protein AVDCRST_MAG55-2483 [uncultured Rubrobacteraceae bacterium]